jgi:hypothetical protein
MVTKLLFAVLSLISFVAFGATCPATKPEPFDTFFQRFSNDQGFAVQRTILPLQMQKWEYGIDKNGKDESAPKNSLLSKSDYLKWVTLSEHMKSNGLKSSIESQTRKAVVVQVSLPNSDWVVLWHFKLQASCWFFWRYEDKSL